MAVNRRMFVAGACCAGAALVAGVSLKAAPPSVAPAGAEAPAFARERFLSHWNCTQAVLEALGPTAGLTPEAVTRVTTPFAAGMWSGLTCGAVTGAMMALGMRYGRDSDGASPEAVKLRVRQLVAAMKGEFGNLDCSALLGTDMATDAGIQEAAGKGLFKSKCPLLVEAAARAALKLMS